MKRSTPLTLAALALCGALSVPAAAAQNARILVKPRPTEVSGQSAAAEASWAERLRNADLAAREASFDALVEEGAGSAAARAMLERWAADGERTELAWSARLALREVQRRPRSAFGGRYGVLPGPSPWGQDFQFHGGLDIEELNRRIEDMWRDVPFDTHQFGAQDDNPFQLPARPGGAARKSSSVYSITVRPGSVKLKVHEEKDGVESEREYEGESIEALKEAHPELREALGGEREGLGLRLGIGRDAQQNPFTYHTMPTPSAPRSDMLGVFVRAAEPDAFPGLERAEGVGLRIDGVVPGTLAERLGLRSGGLLLEIDGRAVRTRDDISAALAARAPEAEITVRWSDDSGAVHASTWSPEAERRSPRVLHRGSQAGQL